MFVGNLNNSEVISKSSFAPFLTRYVKFCPHSWIKRIALRVELYGCRAKGKYTIILPKGCEYRRFCFAHLLGRSCEICFKICLSNLKRKFKHVRYRSSDVWIMTCTSCTKHHASRRASSILVRELPIGQPGNV